ncbi:dihydrolipoyllysine-residue acetyltransferase component of acetoin cleaving system-like isoform X2 [Zingiber officinale]|uniref:AB hydrolase-1 domain-containing protein n=1 Tax=Zingiber officinale TaxID=94328 RepID=A0A8J5G294_ZINOF|nr:dihydrolipoyllysine-residue acetyltransferase component of acetoin cleaving system-like isoform X2 [Zingiber officinale]KAG6498501.1 hypothetical protein ZIOFF_046416 [Zingiber officinale]
MPFCGSSEDGTRIFYRRFGHGNTKVLLIIGLAATHDSWEPQIKGLTGAIEPNDEEEAASIDGDGNLDCDDEESQSGIEVCCFDNRGVGESSIPMKKSQYTTTIMAKDALALLDHLDWKRAHVFGHSMGAMIACKLAALAPERICSLALLNVTGGGFECFPKIDRQIISLAYRFLRAKTPEQRATVDLETHYTKEYLNEYVGLHTRREILYQEYVKAISSAGMQSNCGFEGQVNACWKHKMTAKELDTIRSSRFLISVIHGRYDIIAQLDHARKLAKMLQPSTRMVELQAGHLVTHERTDEVNQALMNLINASKSKQKPEEWYYIPERQTGCLSIRGLLSSLLIVYQLLGKLQLSFLYVIGIFLMGYEHLRNLFTSTRTVKSCILQFLVQK